MSAVFLLGVGLIVGGILVKEMGPKIILLIYGITLALVGLQNFFLKNLNSNNVSESTSLIYRSLANENPMNYNIVSDMSANDPVNILGGFLKKFL
jgi:hypothetical protein